MQLALDYKFEKHFTIDEANAMIPHIRKLFTEIKNLVSLEVPHADGPLKSHANGNGNHGPSAPAVYEEWTKEKRHEAAYRLLNALQQQGIVIQDIERGLIDFPSIRKGREIFLCYELSDGNSIHFFHELDAGFAGRQRISGEHDE